MRLALSAALLLTGLSAAAADTGKDPSGTWLTGDGRALVERVGEHEGVGG